MSMFHYEDTQFGVTSLYAKREIDLRGLLAKG